nr:MAG TPA: hypothetical protein [Caudoviricetes sp.]
MNDRNRLNDLIKAMIYFRIYIRNNGLYCLK